jgi:NAD+ kinase
MIIALFANLKKRNSSEIASQVCQFLKSKGVHLVAHDEEAALLQIPSLSSVQGQKIDFFITLGGDGTILRTLHHFPDLDVPIVGVNLGALGFMADIPVDDVFESLTDLLEGKYRIENRIMMEGKTSDGKSYFAVNDMVVHRGKNPSLIDLAIHVDGNYFNTFSADGVIVSTPNGSTAYSLAAGGPILTPDVHALVITPICAHTISNRPIVLMPKMKIEIEYLSPTEPVELIYDGISGSVLSTGEIFTITPSRRTFKMVSLSRTDYFSTLRTKLGWTGQVRAMRN